MDERERADRPDDASAVEEAGERGGGMRSGLEREYASMGTGEAGAGVGGGGASSSDVESGSPAGSGEGGEHAAEEELTSGGAMTNEQEFTEPT